MGRYLFEFKGIFEIVMLFELLTIFMNVTTSNGHDQPGFISIDCGSTRGNYTDDIGLSWVNDGTYVRTGVNSNRLFTLDRTVENYDALGDFRYFPEHRSKHCYDLPTSSNVSYLVRAMFYYNESESELLPQPPKFNVFINKTSWFTVDYTRKIHGLLVQEGIFYSPGGVIYFCLQPVKGIPFISSLELRQLDQEGIMYEYVGSKYWYLSMKARYNYGVEYNASKVRFPDDAFDRLWDSDTRNEQGLLRVGYGPRNIISLPPQPDAKTSASMNNVPPKVMLDAEALNISMAFLSIDDDADQFSQYNLYVALYFENLNRTETRGQVRTINVYTPVGYVSSAKYDEVYASQPFNITTNASMQVFSNVLVRGNEVILDFDGYFTTENSNHPVVHVNALEVYAIFTFDFTSTSFQVEAMIKALQRSFNLISWHGDPCFPVPHDWLTCYAPPDPTLPPWLNSITLTNLSSDGWPAFINASYHNYGIPINLDTGTYYGLQNISFTHSHIGDVTFLFLIQNLSSSALLGLNVSYNNISVIPPPWVWPPFSFLTSLDLSHNILNGVFSWLSMKPVDPSYMFKELHELYVSDNNISGVSLEDFYFSNLTHLEIVNFDRNNIQGTLNLTTWHDLLQYNKSITGPLFSVVNNSIFDIIPPAEVLEPIITLRLLNKNPHFNKTGILLGGNPYCKGAKSTTHRYLCRYKVTDIIYQERKKNNKLLLAGTICGIFLFLVCCVLFATSWKLWKQVSTLRQIHQALADQKVQPPLYTYSELKLATKDFHSDNKLGNGAFGVVYMGVLLDKSTIAVKKLFNSQQVQVLNEFLNEVVLITGIKHKNLVQLKGCCINDKQRILVYEHVENGNLAEALWGAKNRTSKISILDWQQRFNICVGVARGLLYLHEELQPRIIHRDIKPANILLDKNLNPKIADFGLARHFLDEQSQAQFTSIAGTRGYFAPEYASEGKLTEKADVFSFGILVLEIVSGRKVIDYNMPPERVFLKDWVQKSHKDGTLLQVLQPELLQNCVEEEVIRVINIALICVQMNPERRATMSQVLTMFLGSTDVTSFLDNMGNHHQPYFNVLLPANNHHSIGNISPLQMDNIVVEGSGSEESSLLPVDSESSLPLHYTISTHSIATIEPSDMSGR